MDILDMAKVSPIWPYHPPEDHERLRRGAAERGAAQSIGKSRPDVRESHQRYAERLASKTTHPHCPIHEEHPESGTNASKATEARFLTHGPKDYGTKGPGDQWTRLFLLIP